MAYPDDLLEQASHLARRERTRPRQASLRRALSTAYYALFHLLVAEAAANWRIQRQRADLLRSIEHSRMRAAAARFAASSVSAALRQVAATFVDAQRDRQSADYDTARTWSRKEAAERIEQVRTAFDAWRRVREQDAAQDFLFAFLVKDRT